MQMFIQTTRKVFHVCACSLSGYCRWGQGPEGKAGGGGGAEGGQTGGQRAKTGGQGSQTSLCVDSNPRPEYSHGLHTVFTPAPHTVKTHFPLFHNKAL